MENALSETKTTLKERFKYMREEVIGLSQQKLADKLEIKQQTIANIESGRKQKIDTEILYKLSEEYTINTEWLIFGIGNINKIDDYDEYSHKYYNDNVVAIRKYDFNKTEEENINNNIENDKDALYFDRRWLRNILGVNPDNVFFTYAPDDSMYSGMDASRDIKKDDILFVDISQKQGNDKVFIYKDDFDNKQYIRQIRWSMSENIKLIPRNTNYKTEVIEKGMDEFLVNIIGRVVWNGSKESL